MEKLSEGGAESVRARSLEKLYCHNNEAVVAAGTSADAAPALSAAERRLLEHVRSMKDSARAMLFALAESHARDFPLQEAPAKPAQLRLVAKNP